MVVSFGKSVCGWGSRRERVIHVSEREPAAKLHRRLHVIGSVGQHTRDEDRDCTASCRRGCVQVVRP